MSTRPRKKRPRTVHRAPTQDNTDKSASLPTLGSQHSSLRWEAQAGHLRAHALKAFDVPRQAGAEQLLMAVPAAWQRPSLEEDFVRAAQDELGVKMPRVLVATPPGGDTRI